MRLVSQLKLETLIRDEVTEFAGGLNEVSGMVQTCSTVLILYSREDDAIHFLFTAQESFFFFPL